MNTFKLVVSSPDGNIFEGDVVRLDIRGVEGELAIMAGHIPFVTTVVSSSCTLNFPDETKKTAHLDGGLLTVGKESATLLAGTFEFDE